MYESKNPEDWGIQEDHFFQRLYQDNYEKLLHFVLYAMKEQNLAAAEDVVQDTFYEALRRIEVLREHPNPSGWLVQTARNKLRAMTRRFSAGEVGLEELLDEPQKQEAGFGMIELSMLMDGIFSCHEKEMFEKYYLEGYSVKEMAESEQLTESAFKVKMHRLKQRLMRESGMIAMSALMLGLCWYRG